MRRYEIQLRGHYFFDFFDACHEAKGRQEVAHFVTSQITHLHIN